MKPDRTIHRLIGDDGTYPNNEKLPLLIYPDGQNRDMNYGEDSERPQADRNIAGVPLPEMDPVFGANGPLLKQCHKK